MILIQNIFNKKTMAQERNDPRFTAVFDLDNTLADDFGKKLRPGIKDCLSRLMEKKIKLVIWTNSEIKRAMNIVHDFGLGDFFYGIITKESYMLSEFEGRGPGIYKEIIKTFPREEEFQKRFDIGKNIGHLGYDVLVDDNPQVIREAEFWNNAYQALVCEPYRGHGLSSPGQMDKIAKKILSLSRPSFFKRLMLWE